MNILSKWSYDVEQYLLYKDIYLTCDFVMLHDSFSVYFQLSAYSSIPPSIHVEIPSFKTVMMSTPEVQATCLVHTGFDAKVTWLMDGRLPQINTVSQDSNTTHIFSNVRVSSSQWKQLKNITCRAEHACFSIAEKSISVAGKTTIQHENQTCRDSKEPKLIHSALFSLSIIQSLQPQLHQWRSGDLYQIC